MAEFVSRAGAKLEHAMEVFGIDVAGKVCADLGSNTGGFVDCLLRRGAAEVYAVEKGYGVLEWKLRKDPRVIAMERTNAMHVVLPEKVAFVSVDVSWTKQRHILPAVKRLLASDGCAVVLIKPHYEADPKLLNKGVLPDEHVEAVVAEVLAQVGEAGLDVVKLTPSPIRGREGNVEMLALLRVAEPGHAMENQAC